MLEWVLYVALGVVVAVALWSQTTEGKAHSVLRRFPGPPGLLGNVGELRGAGTDGPKLLSTLLSFYYARFGSPSVIWFGPWMSVHIFKPEHVEVLLKSSGNLSKSRDYDQVKTWLGDGLLMSKGTKWTQRRKLLTPAFHFSILKEFVDSMNAESRLLCQGLRARPEGLATDVAPAISLCALDIICETAMGYQLGAQGGGDSAYVAAISDFGEIVMWRSLRQWWWNDFIFFNFSARGRRQRRNLNVLHAFTKKVIQERVEQRGNGERVKEVGKRRAFLDLLLDMVDENRLTLHDVREETDTFMFEGHDTTATGLQWLVYLLGLHPEIQEKARAEVDSVWSDEDGLRAEDLGGLSYVESCIKESQRLYPSVPLIIRVLDTPLQIDPTWTLPVGSVVNVPIVMLHQDASQFPAPARFDPDRFRPDVAAARHPFAFLPFSAGQRNCIGQRFALMEEKVMIAHLLHNFAWSSEEQPEEMRPAMQMILKPTKGVVVKLTRRNDSAKYS